jgi:DUF4097 and DUF4098 domain-containing protein YvlB
MPPSLERRSSPRPAVGRNVRTTWCLGWFLGVAITSLACFQQSRAQGTTEIHRTLVVPATEILIFDVEIASGDLQILYGRDGQVSISGYAKASAEAKVDDTFFPSVLTIDQQGNHLNVRQTPSPAYPQKAVSIFYRIEVPYRTEVTSKVGQGKQNIIGILGPVKAATLHGNITASYVSKNVHAQVDYGNLDLQEIGEHVEATTGSGNITCARVSQGVSAETIDGDIYLAVVGPSQASVKTGTGRLEVSAARGTFVGSTQAGDLHITAIPHDAWRLSSASGNIRVELPPTAKFELDAAVGSGKVVVDREDIAKPTAEVRHIHDQVNGGGKLIEAHSDAGTIVIR